jgi:hypothetical protein
MTPEPTRHQRRKLPDTAERLQKRLLELVAPSRGNQKKAHSTAALKQTAITAFLGILLTTLTALGLLRVAAITPEQLLGGRSPAFEFKSNPTEFLLIWVKPSCPFEVNALFNLRLLSADYLSVEIDLLSKGTDETWSAENFVQHIKECDSFELRIGYPNGDVARLQSIGFSGMQVTLDELTNTRSNYTYGEITEDSGIRKYHFAKSQLSLISGFPGQQIRFSVEAPSTVHSFSTRRFAAFTHLENPFSKPPPIIETRLQVGGNLSVLGMTPAWEREQSKGYYGTSYLMPKGNGLRPEFIVATIQDQHLQRAEFVWIVILSTLLGIGLAWSLDSIRLLFSQIIFFRRDNQ